MISNGMSPVVDRLVNIDIAVADFQVKTTLRIGANPGLILDRGALTTEIGKGHQVTSFAFLAFGEISIRFQKSTSHPV
jgi:hypothetical protein